MKRFFHHFKFSMFAVSVLCLALGAALLIWPDQAQQFFCYAFGALLVLSGIFQVASYLVGSQRTLLQRLILVGGIIAAVAGVWILLAPKKVLTLAVIVLGIVLLYHGIMDIKYSFDMKRCEFRHWSIAMVAGLILCGVGILMLVNPFQSMSFLFFIMALGFLFDGLSGLYTVAAVAQAERRFELASARISAIEGTGEILPEEEAGKAPGEQSEEPRNL